MSADFSLAYPTNLPRILVVAHDDQAAAEIVRNRFDSVRAAVLAQAAAAEFPAGAFALRFLDVSGMDDAEATALLGRLDDGGASTIVECATAQLDTIGNALMASRAVLLCDPLPIERAGSIALALSGGGQRRRVTDKSRDADQRLQRLNDEVARIAETLARLTGRDGPRAEDARIAHRGAQIGGEPPVRGTGRAATVRSIIRARRLRDQHLDRDLFADPAWDILLDLHAAQIEQAQVSVSSLCIAAAVPPTTALRWIQTLSDRDLVERRDDPFDKRRAYIGLSERGRTAMDAYFTALGARVPPVI